MIQRVFAQSLTLPDGTTVVGPATNFTNLGSLISQAIPYVFLFAGIALLLMLILGGFSLLTGANDPKQLEAGKQKVTLAIAGFAIVFAAYWVVQIAARMFGLTEFMGIFH